MSDVTTEAPQRPAQMPLDLPANIAVVVAMLAMAGAAFAGEVAAHPRPSMAALVLDALAGVAASAALPWLWRRPVVAVVVFVGMSAVFPTATPLAATAVLWLAGQRRLPVAIAAAGAGVGALLVRGVWRPVSGLSIGWWAVLVVATYAALVGWGAWMQARRALITSLEQRARRAEADQAERVEEARRAERTRIAREMHDVLAHRLSLLATAAGALSYHRDAPADQLARAAEVVRSTAHQALEELRDVIGVLRAEVNGPANTGRPERPERPQPTMADLPALVAESCQAGVVVELDDHLDDAERARIPTVLGRTVYRAVQEALTNARKHAPGATVRIALRGHPGQRLEVEVTNSIPPPKGLGPRRPSVPGGGMGLVGLAERVHLAGGGLQHGATAAGEFRIWVWLPWPS